MRQEYADWIAANFSGTGYGRCSEATAQMAEAFPELRVLLGCVNGDLANWFERWFESDTKAISYAQKRGWSVENEM